MASLVFSAVVLASVAIAIFSGLLLLWRREHKLIATLSSTKDQVTSRIGLAQALLPPIGSLFVLLGVIVTWFQVVSSLDTAQRQLQLAAADQVSQRYKAALETLSSQSSTARIGAVYALKQIAIEHPTEYLETVNQLLSSFVRSRATRSVRDEGKKKRELWPPDEVRLTLKVLSNLNTHAGPISGTLEEPKFRPNVRGIYLADAMLDGAELSSLDLEDSNFERAHLQGVQLGYSHLMRAKLQAADLTKGRLEHLSLRYSNLEKATLESANLSNCDCVGADLRQTHLIAADLTGANLTRADFGRASVMACNWSKADLFDVKGLDSVDGLAQQDLAETQANSSVTLPSTIARPPKWSHQ